MVSVISFFSDDQSSNPAEDFCFLANCLKRMKINDQLAVEGQHF